MEKLGIQVRDRFKKRFGEEPFLVRSPGRVNLIGEHTDYNNGFVLPAAIDKVIMVAIASNGSNSINIESIDKKASHSHNLDNPLEKTSSGWPDYILGAVDQLRKAGYIIEGFDCVFGGDIPIGAGLSSSAALEGGIIFGLSSIFNLDVSSRDMALLGQKTENEFVGVQCGIMDQFVNIHGKDGHALKLDCRSLDYELYPFEQQDIHIVLCDTQIRRELASSEYNVRRGQCEKGVELLSQYETAVESLRDVSEDLLEEHRQEMDPVIYKRCRFVIDENIRVEDACRDLVNEDIEAFGRRMYGSHAGLRDMYEVSCSELDLLVEEAQNIDGVLGARMMGGGFGGCTINLVRESALNRFSSTIQKRYAKKTGNEIEVYLTRIGAGTKLLRTGGEKELLR